MDEVIVTAQLTSRALKMVGLPSGLPTYLADFVISTPAQAPGPVINGVSQSVLLAKRHKEVARKALGKSGTQRDGRSGDPQRQNRQVRDVAVKLGMDREKRAELRLAVEYESRNLGRSMNFLDIEKIAKLVTLGAISERF